MRLGGSAAAASRTRRPSRSSTLVASGAGNPQEACGAASCRPDEPDPTVDSTTRMQMTPTRPRIPKSRYAVVLIAAAAVTGVLIVASQLSARDGTTAASATNPSTSAAAHAPSLFAGIRQQGTALGSPNAPFTLVEYADLQCPYCARWARDALPTVVANYVKPGKLRIIFNGMAFVGPDSRKALQTAIAAGRERHLWDVVHGLYAAQGAENTNWVTDQLVTEIAAGVPGLDGAKLLRARSSPWVESELVRAAAAAEAAGVHSTPSFQFGPTGGPFHILRIDSLGPEGIATAVDSALAG
jgi:protein-disulfide isomerase